MVDKEQLIITLVESQKRNSHRFNIYLNDEFAFSTHEDVVVKFRLLKGTILTEQLRHDVLAEEELNAAYRVAIRYIGHAMRTTKEVQDKLINKGYSLDIIDVVIKRMAEHQFVNDEFYASALARQRLRTNKKGSLWIRRELIQKGVDKSKVEQALTQFDPSDETEHAWQLAIKRWSITKGEKLDKLRKIIALLQRRGFTPHAVRAVSDRLRRSELDEITTDDWNDENEW